jgi:K+-transporting ATPase KdpF subunit
LARCASSADGEARMTILNVLAGVIALGLLVYLVLALLDPELFS